MAYGTVKVDTVTFTYASGDTSTTFSGLHASTTNNLTLSGTASANTFTGTTANFTNTNAQNISVTTALSGLAITGGTAGFTTVTGTTVTGTTANFVSGVFSTQVSGVTITGTTVAATTGNFTSLTGTTTTGTTANFASGVFTTQVSGVTVIATTGTFTSLTGTTTTGTTANFVSGVFTTQISGVTITGTTVSTTTGNFISLTGTTATITSGIIASGTAALPSLAILSDLNTGIYSPGADQLAISTNGTKRLQVDTGGNISIDAVTDTGLKPLGIYSQARDCEIKLTTNSGTENSAFLTLRQSGGKLDFYSTNGDIALNPGNSLAATFKSDGKVGIGTSSPVGKLHVIGDSATPGVGNINISNAAFPTAGWVFRIPDSASIIDLSLDGAIAGTPRSVMYFERATGNVGIGTTSPAGKCVVHVSNNTGAPTAWNSNFLLVSNGDTSTSSGIGFSVDGSDSSASISALTPGTTWLKQHYRANSHVFWYGDAGVTQAATIDTSGRLLVGTSTNLSGSLLQVHSTTPVITAMQSATDVPINTLLGAFNAFSNDISSTSSGGEGGIRIYSETAFNTGQSPSYMSFYTHGAAANDGTEFGNVTEQMRIKANGDVSVVTGNLIIGTAGKGIDFSATTNSSGTMTNELLSDYEEGTFTPILADAATGGNVAASYTAREGIYTKIGRSVSVTCKIVFPVTTGMTAGNQIFVRGLPFSAAQQSFGSLFIRNITLPAGYTFAQSFLHQEQSNTVQFPAMGSAVSEVYLTVASISSGTGLLMFAFTYNV